jgi:hypothetical protein
MNDKSINEMAQKYKEEMMRLYKNSANSANSAGENTAIVTQKNTASVSEKVPITPQTETQKNLPVISTSPKANHAGKFPSPDDIVAAESENSATEHNQGNYDFTPPANTDEELQPLYTGEEGSSVPDSELTGTGYLTAEVTTGEGAVPVPGAAVIISRREGELTHLIRMLIADESGSTETVSLPAPDIRYSESPETTEKPFANYSIAVYAEGFYTVPEIVVPVFSTVKSIQPVSLIPLSKYDTEGSVAPSAAGSAEEE